MRQHFLYFVPSDSMLFPNLLRNEGLNDELVEPKFNAILSATSKKTTDGQVTECRLLVTRFVDSLPQGARMWRVESLRLNVKATDTQPSR